MSDVILWARLVDSLRKNDSVLRHILQSVSQEQASTWQDGLDEPGGPDGWTPLLRLAYTRRMAGRFWRWFAICVIMMPFSENGGN